MIIRFLSDVHLEDHHNPKALLSRLYTQDKPDITLIAGDMCPGNLHSSYRDMMVDALGHILYVPGNHDYWGMSPRQFHDMSRKNNNPKFQYLNFKIHHIGDIRIIGCTLWFPHTIDADLYQHGMNDFWEIKKFKPWVYNQARASITFLNKYLDAKTILLCHHLPTPASLDPNYASSKLNCYFLHNIEQLLLERQPKLVVHGHTHASCDYWIGNTHVVCNPYGYHDLCLLNPKFNYHCCLNII
jgi:Icc-related predicted phosphoesterase